MKKFLFMILAIYLLPFSVVQGRDRGVTMFGALFDIRDQKVPNNSTHCGINGETKTHDGKYINNPLTVGDFLDAYLKFHGSDAQKKIISLGCNEEHDPPYCSLNYGQHPNSKNPGWNMVLRFDYDGKSGKVDKNSLICIQVP